MRSADMRGDSTGGSTCTGLRKIVGEKGGCTGENPAGKKEAISSRRKLSPFPAPSETAEPGTACAETEPSPRNVWRSWVFTLSVKNRCTSWLRANRTSVLVGCTLTSTSPGSREKNKYATGNVSPGNKVRVASC